MMTVEDALSFADRMYTPASFAGVLAAEVRRLREENERLRKDAERLDDLDTIAQRRESSDMHLCNGYISLYLRTSIGNTHGIRRKDIRAAIDAARGAK